MDATTALTHNSYHDGGVQSIGFDRHGRALTVGVIAPGSYHFGTAAPERMTVVTGELTVRRDGADAWSTYPAGTQFEVAGSSGFDVRADGPSAYLCEYL